MTYDRNVFDIADSSLVLTTNIIRFVNETIYTSETIEENEQVVNEIYLSELGQDRLQFSQDAIDQLEVIAYQCPMAGGKAVFRARAELSRYGIISFYDDKYNCAQLGYSRQMQQQDAKGINRNNLFVLFPNPVSDQLYLFSDKAITSQSFIILDISGRAVLKSNTVFKNGIAELDISTLVPGVYSISTKNDLYLGNRSKFTVIR